MICSLFYKLIVGNAIDKTHFLFKICSRCCTLTEIKIIGNPGQQPVEILKTWLEDALKKFEISLDEIWIAFFEKPKELKKYFEKWSKVYEELTLEWRSVVLKARFRKGKIIYLRERDRKGGIPPILLIRKGKEIFRENIFHEIAHVKEDQKSWSATVYKAIELSGRDTLRPLMDSRELSHFLTFFSILVDEIQEFFCNGMMCQYGLFKEILADKRRNLLLAVEGTSQKRDKFVDFTCIMMAAFRSVLPRGYPRKEETEEKLEGMVIDKVCHLLMKTEYQKIKEVVSKLEISPEINNVYSCCTEILKLAQEFLEK